MKKYSASDQLRAMSNQWANNQSIMIIGGIGLNKAIQVRKNIENDIKKDGYILPKPAIVPMKNVIDYFKIDINYLKKLAKLDRGD